MTRYTVSVYFIYVLYNLFSSPGPKAQVSFYDQNVPLSVVFIFIFFSLEPLSQLKRIATRHAWVKDLNVYTESALSRR